MYEMGIIYVSPF